MLVYYLVGITRYGFGCCNNEIEYHMSQSLTNNYIKTTKADTIIILVSIILIEIISL